MNQLKSIFLCSLMGITVGLQAMAPIIAPTIYTPIQLSRVVIDSHKKNITEDIVFKRKLKPALIATLLVASAVYAGASTYQSIAACNSLFNWTVEIKNWFVSCFWTIPSKDVVISEATFKSLTNRVGSLENSQYATLFAILYLAGHLGVFALVSEKFKLVTDAVLNYDSYKRFFTHNQLLKEIDFMRHSAHLIEMPNQTDLTKEYHTKELVRLSEEVILQAEETIAFLEYKTEKSNPEIIAQYSLDAKAPYLFAITNELITELMAVISTSSDKKLVSLIDAYRAEVKLMIDTCCTIQ